MKIVGIELIMSEYVTDPDFSEIFALCSHHAVKDFHLHNGFLFKGSRLCIPRNSLRTQLIQELHEGSLAGHFGADKTSALMKQYYF